MKRSHSCFLLSYLNPAPTLLTCFLFMLCFPGLLPGQTMQQELKEVKETQTVFLQTQLDERVTKIINTPDFVRAANVSLNALVLSNSLTDYLNDVSNLNNPTNDELGFSLTHRVEEIMARHIGTGKNKKGFARVMEIAKGVVEHPLVSTLTSAIPVVNSLGSVIDLVNGFAVQNHDVPVQEVNLLREEVTKYVQHYQSLADATRKFQGTVAAVQERTTELQLILISFTNQRVENLFPEQAAEAVAAPSLRNVLLKIYEKDRVVQSVQTVLAKYKDGEEASLGQVLTDPHMVYPEYVVNEARFMLDELVAITKEYIIAFNEYQNDLRAVLEKSKDLGEAEKIDRKIALLDEKLKKVEEAFLNAVHVEEVEYRFKALARTQVTETNTTNEK